MDKITILTFEDWQGDNWPTWAKHITRPFEKKWDTSEKKTYSLSGEEYQKIENAQKAIFEKWVALFLKGQTDNFEQRFSSSLATDELLSSELKKVERWQMDKDAPGAYPFPNPNGGHHVVGWFAHEGEDVNKLPVWHNKLIVQGGKAHAYMEPGHEIHGDGFYAVAAYVLYKYRQYLEERIKGSDSQPTEKKRQTAMQKDLLKFEDAVKEPGKLPGLWKCLSQMKKPLVTVNGGYIERKQPHAILMALAQSLVSKEKMKSQFSVNQTYLMLCDYLEIESASRPDKTPKTTRYKDFLADFADCT